MSRFIFKILIFLMLSFSLILGTAKYLSQKVENREFANYDSEENLFTIKKNQHYGILFMGISHARNFTRFKNQLRVEEILNCKVLNIGRGGGKCGAEAEYVYLKYLYSRGNTIEKIVYVPTPPMIFSDYLDNNSSIFEYEPFRLRFFYLNLISDQENKNQQLYYYIRSKYNKKWLKFKPYSVDSNKTILAKYDTSAVNNGFKLAYPKGLDTVAFKRNTEIIRKTVDLCQKHNTKVIFLMTPAMFGEWPGNDEVFKFLDELKTIYPIEVYDYSEVCKDSTLYFDHHHLNSEGVSWFTEEYLKPILTGTGNRINLSSGKNSINIGNNE